MRSSRKQKDGSAKIFFQSLGKNICSFQPALKTLHMALKGSVPKSSLGSSVWRSTSDSYLLLLYTYSYSFL